MTKNLPETFLNAMHQVFEQYGMDGEWPAFLASFSDSPARAYRYNGLKLSDMQHFRLLSAELSALQNLETLDSPVPWSSDGLYMQDNLQAGKTNAFRAGLFYIQEASAMLPAEVLAVEPGEKILDLCAAPGGKSAKLAAALQGKGLLWSNDINAERAKVLLRNLEQLGVANAMVSVAEPSALARALPAYFDRILVDAPCSGEGMFRRDPKAIKSWASYSNEKLLDIQAGLLAAASRMLKEGGFLVYSTCTFNRAENEMQIESFLASHPEFITVDVSERYIKEAGLSPALGDLHALRVWPQRNRGDGHFTCLLQKQGRIQGEKLLIHATSAASRKSLEEARASFLALAKTFLSPDFLGQIEALPLDRWRLENMRLHLLPDVFVPIGIPAVKLLKTGRFVAELKETRQGLALKVSHSFLLTLTRRQLAYALDLESDEKRLAQYLRGETLSLDEAERSALPETKKDLWLPVCWKKQPLGWAKLQGLVAKNLYPPGWRDLN